ncbi:DUF58 domain-containing protein [Vibrio nigripulchritudo]|uniref:DUF58 domain-containing protein n=1 Tax=Vibrio nigripulchritudo TaxID=28173 RepID=UPI002490BEC2|nr:DUF58 domain-containing protein [Vibrio nigripulchritudo]BDU40590.1 hypothetical protein TUMSATVNIG2_50590 [Vibrio nigripulchritudo]BDU46327.1 hypothetical protein TUMSATVNIG3_51250 [Vibrio nigripulchritudo]
MSQLPPYANGAFLSIEELLYYKSQTCKWLPPAKSLWSQLSGSHQSRAKGRGMNFAEVRQYQAGDDIRSIDWRVTARTGKVHTKLFEEEREQPVILFIDLSSSMRFGSSLLLKSVQAAHLASLVGWLSVQTGDRLGAVISDGHKMIDIKPTARAKGVLNVLDSLINAHNESLQSTEEKREGLGWTTSLEALHRLCPKGSDIVLLSDFLSFEDDEFVRLSQIAQHNRIRAIQIFDPLEQGVTHYKGQNAVSDGRRSRWVDFSSSKTKQSFQQDFESRSEKLKSGFNKLGIHFSHISCGESLMEQLHRG